MEFLSATNKKNLKRYFSNNLSKNNQTNIIDICIDSSNIVYHTNKLTNSQAEKKKEKYIKNFKFKDVDIYNRISKGLPNYGQRRITYNNLRRNGYNDFDTSYFDIVKTCKAKTYDSEDKRNFYSIYTSGEYIYIVFNLNKHEHNSYTSDIRIYDISFSLFNTMIEKLNDFNKNLNNTPFIDKKYISDDISTNSYINNIAYNDNSYSLLKLNKKYSFINLHNDNNNIINYTNKEGIYRSGSTPKSLNDLYYKFIIESFNINTLRPSNNIISNYNRNEYDRFNSITDNIENVLNYIKNSEIIVDISDLTFTPLKIINDTSDCIFYLLYYRNENNRTSIYLVTKFLIKSDRSINSYLNNILNNGNKDVDISFTLTYLDDFTDSSILYNKLKLKNTFYNGFYHSSKGYIHNYIYSNLYNNHYYYDEYDEYDSSYNEKYIKIKNNSSNKINIFENDFIIYEPLIEISSNLSKQHIYDISINFEIVIIDRKIKNFIIIDLSNNDDNLYILSFYNDNYIRLWENNKYSFPKLKWSKNYNNPNYSQDLDLNLNITFLNNFKKVALINKNIFEILDCSDISNIDFDISGNITTPIPDQINEDFITTYELSSNILILTTKRFIRLNSTHNYIDISINIHDISYDYATILTNPSDSSYNFIFSYLNNNNNNNHGYSIEYKLLNLYYLNTDVNDFSYNIDTSSNKDLSDYNHNYEDYSLTTILKNNNISDTSNILVSILKDNSSNNSEMYISREFNLENSLTDISFLKNTAADINFNFDSQINSILFIDDSILVSNSDYIIFLSTTKLSVMSIDMIDPSNYDIFNSIYNYSNNNNTSNIDNLKLENIFDNYTENLSNTDKITILNSNVPDFSKNIIRNIYKLNYNNLYKHLSSNLDPTLSFNNTVKITNIKDMNNNNNSSNYVLSLDNGQIFNIKIKSAKEMIADKLSNLYDLLKIIYDEVVEEVEEVQLFSTLVRTTGSITRIVYFY